jgi:hypothetical protein
MDEVLIIARHPGMFEKVVGDKRSNEFVAALASARGGLEGRTVW